MVNKPEFQFVGMGMPASILSLAGSLGRWKALQ
jgi:hypothetical protein